MPRPERPGDEGKEVKKRSRNGCWPCKARKVKCGEEKPSCANCQRQGETCDYSIRLNWGGRAKKKEDDPAGFQTISFTPDLPPPTKRPAMSPTNSGGSQMIASARGNKNIDHHYPPHSLSRQSSGGSSDQLPSISNFSSPLPALNGSVSDIRSPHIPMLRNPIWTENAGSNGNTPGLAPTSYLRQTLSYPSPAESSFDSPNYLGSGFTFNEQSLQMPPPTFNSNQATYQDMAQSPYNNAKRMRMSPRHDSFTKTAPSLLQRNHFYGSNTGDEPTRVQFNSSMPPFFPSYNKDPLTPATSMIGASVDNDDRRISVSSLLSEDPNPDDQPRKMSYPYDTLTSSDLPRRGSLHQRMISYSETETYGQDRGNPDLDIPRNNDTMAITGTTPSEHSEFESWLNDADIGISEFGFRLESREVVFAKGGYYASPVPIKIPRKLEPLPTTLSENPMNLLYFHHFLNHTARILVPHDCPENPFKTILPKMAVDNPHLLNLLLSYSACHRARLLGHPEPANRIAMWVRDVFPALRQSLDEVSTAEISNANLATAIMLTSLEIISPSGFGVSIPWQDHLGVARSIIRARGGPHSISRKDPVMYFLTRWLAYLDVLGSLSGQRSEEPLFAGNYWASSHDGNSAKELSLTDDDGDDDDDYTIDCLLGFTTKCVSILAQVALLARQCEEYRINPDTGQPRSDWRPSSDTLKKAEKLRRDLENARNHEQKQCDHHSPQLMKASLVDHAPVATHYVLTNKDAEESVACNNAFHLAGLVHLLRRVHNLPRPDTQVQTAVHEIVKILQTIRTGGSAEACLLFPMFTAGVEAENPLDRAEILVRIKAAEEVGMCQVSRARKIIEEVWRTGICWESLVTGEFFG